MAQPKFSLDEPARIDSRILGHDFGKPARHILRVHEGAIDDLAGLAQFVACIAQQ